MQTFFKTVIIRLLLFVLFVSPVCSFKLWSATVVADASAAFANNLKTIPAKMYGFFYMKVEYWT